MEAPFHPFLTKPDVLVWHNLNRDIELSTSTHESDLALTDHNGDTLHLLSDINNPKNERFQPTVFTSWDDDNIPLSVLHYVVRPYTEWAKTVSSCANLYLQAQNTDMSIFRLSRCYRCGP